MVICGSGHQVCCLGLTPLCINNGAKWIPNILGVCPQVAKHALAYIDIQQKKLA